MLACDLVIPPRPKRLSSTATEAEKQVRDALMKERKRCQDAVNHGKRARGADRSGEEIGAVAASNIISHGKRVNSVDHGGHRDGTGGHREGAGRKPEDVVANSIRRGDPKYDLWPLKLCRNEEMYAHLPKKISHPIKFASLSDTAATIFMEYHTAKEN
jgi:hypothetical protein